MLCFLLCSWSQGSSGSSSGSTSGLSQGALLAAIIVPIIVASALLGTLLACCYCRHYNKHTDAAGKDIDSFGKAPLLPSFLSGAFFGRKGSGGKVPGLGPSAALGKGSAGSVVVSVKDGTVSFVEKSPASATSAGPEGTVEHLKSINSLSNSASRSRAQSGFNDDIAQVGVGKERKNNSACQLL